MIHSLRARLIIHIFIVVAVCLFMFLVIQTGINTRLYSEQVKKEIHTTVRLSIDKVDRYTHTMEQKVGGLASAGELFYKILKSSPEKNLDAQMQSYLIREFSTFREAVGGGLWYEPYKFYADKKYYGPYAFWENNQVKFTWDLTTPKYNYLEQDWYTLALPTNWDRTEKREQDYYWTRPYFDEAGTFLLMITVDAFMHDDDGSIIGITTADWSIETMVDFLRKSKISEDSDIFLVDMQSNFVLANTHEPESVMKSAANVPWMNMLLSPQKDVIKEVAVTIDGTPHYAYYALTDAGMLYGMLVPFRVLSDITDKLIRESIISAIILGVLLVSVLYFSLSAITNSIIALTEGVSRIAGGDLTARVSISAKDEIGQLASSFNEMTGKLSETYLHLGDEKARLLASINSLSFGFIIADMEDHVVLANKALNDQFGFNVGDSITIKQISLLIGEHHDLKMQIKRCFSDAAVCEIKNINFGTKTLRGIIAPIHSGEGAADIGYVLLFEDITEAKVIERSREEFFAVASHELRTPLTAIQGNMALFRDFSSTLTDTEKLEMVSDTYEASVRLIGIVNQFLDTSRLEQGKTTFAKELVDISELIRKTCKEMAPLAKAKGLVLSFIEPDVLIPNVIADTERMKQAILIFVDNAVKYTEKGMVTVSVAHTERDVVVSITDSGVGISSQNQALLFRKFQQAGEKMLSRDTSKSTGLGLYITKLIVEAMGGRVRLSKSKLGEGSTFELSMPIKPK